MYVLERSDDSLTLRFDGIIDAIEVVVFCNEISVPVNHDGLIWDTHCSGSSANQKPSPMAWCAISAILLSNASFLRIVRCYTTIRLKKLAAWARPPTRR
jgi:hypothetical protein